MTDYLPKLLDDASKKEANLFEKGILTTDNGPKSVFLQSKVGKKTILNSIKYIK